MTIDRIPSINNSGHSSQNPCKKEIGDLHQAFSFLLAPSLIAAMPLYVWYPCVAYKEGSNYTPHPRWESGYRECVALTTTKWIATSRCIECRTKRKSRWRGCRRWGARLNDCLIWIMCVLFPKIAGFLRWCAATTSRTVAIIIGTRVGLNVFRRALSRGGRT
jgi:hypothetical protein